MKFIYLIIVTFTLTSCNEHTVESEFEQFDSVDVVQNDIEHSNDSINVVKHENRKIDCSRVVQEYNSFGRSRYFEQLVEDSLQNNLCDTNTPSNLLYRSLKDSLFKLTEYLLKHKVSPDTKLHENGLSTRDYFSVYGDVKTMKLLHLYSNNEFTTVLDRGVCTNILSLALREQNFQNASWLMKYKELYSLKGCDEDQYKVHPIFAATENRYYSIIEKLLNNGINPLTRSDYEGEDCIMCMIGVTPMHILAFKSYDSISVRSSYKTLELFKRQVNDLFIRDSQGNTPIDIAAFYGDTIMIEEFIEHKSFKQVYLNEALINASMFSDYSTVFYLLKKGADPNFKKDNFNALMSSIDCCGDGFGEGILLQDRVKTIKLLINFGLNINVGTTDGANNIDWIKKRREVSELLKL